MFDGPDDILADAVRQWRAQPAADGPGPVALARTVERTRAAAGEGGGPLAMTMSSGASERDAARGGADAGELPSSSRFALFLILRERFAGTSPWVRFAAAAVLVLGLVGGMMLFTEHRAVAFADVKRQIQGARSLTYKMRMEQGDKALDFKIYLRLPGQMRQEAPGELITVFDFQKQRSVSLIPKQKQAMVLDIRGAADLVREKELEARKSAQPFNELLDGQKQDLGRRQIDGKPAIGYRLTQAGMTMNLWVDPWSGNPVRIELPAMKVTITDFVINPPLDDRLFTLDIPPDYKVTEQKLDLADVSERDFVTGIGVLAKWNGDKFPDQPTLTPEMMKNMKERASATTKPTTQEAMDLSQAFGRMILFMVRLQQDGGKFEYFGGGVTVGDKTPPIAWWQPKDAKAYRVLYGDLRVEDADPGKLPATRPSGG
jgi:outer membrane lipoprotein-sorting protein